MGPQDANVQLPPDSTNNKNKIRVIELTPPITVADGDGTTVVVQEVVALGDDDGYFLTRGGSGAQKLDVALQLEQLQELREIKRGLAHLIHVVHNGMRPKDSFAEVHAWVSQALAGDSTGE